MGKLQYEKVIKYGLKLNSSIIH